MTRVISGFPGVGKSFIFNNSGIDATDSDSSHFSWIEKGVRHPDFPNNYIQHIKSLIGRKDYIFVSSHKVVRDALKENGIDYAIVYPSIELKDEYIARYKSRGSDDAFIAFISNNWDSFIKEIEEEDFPTHIKLMEDEYLKDVL